MPIDYELLGKRIAYYRNKAALSQDALADIVHVNKYHINRIEKGHANPSPDLLVDIANAMNVTLDDLLTDSLQHLSEFSRLHQLLDNCSPDKGSVIIRNAENLSQILDELNIK